MIEKVGVYCRLSDEDRDKLNKTDDSDSIINQRSMCLKYANQNGWNVVDIYSDDDFSGAGTYRPDFERLIKDCESKKINLVLCKSQSRFSRDMGVIEYYLHNKFIEWGTRFVSIVDNADTNVEANKKSRQINGLINEWYLDDLSQNIRKSLKNKREDGLFMGSFAPYGYDRGGEDGHKLVIDPPAAEVVKKIFQMYADGYGYHKICIYLNDHNIPSRAIYKKQKGSNFFCSVVDYKSSIWTVDTIAQILRNEVYIGNLVQGKSTYVSYKNHKQMKVPEKEWTRVENTHEPIIDIDTWNKVQSILGTHFISPKREQKNYFTRKVYCSCCNRPFMRNVFYASGPNHTKVLKAYMRCKGNFKFHTCHNNRSIRMDKLEEIIITAINDLIKKYYDKDNLQEIYEQNQKFKSDDKEKLEALNKEINNLTKRINDNKIYYRNLYEDKIKGNVNEDMFNMMSKDYLNEIENMTKRMKIIEEDIKRIETAKSEKKNAENVMKKYKQVKELNRVILDEFVDKIYIGELDKETNTRNIEIEWNFTI